MKIPVEITKQLKKQNINIKKEISESLFLLSNEKTLSVLETDTLLRELPLPSNLKINSIEVKELFWEWDYFLHIYSNNYYLLNKDKYNLEGRIEIKDNMLFFCNVVVWEVKENASLIINYEALLNQLLEYKEKDISIFNKDCFDLLSEIEDKSIDLVLIDPPYFISRDTNFASWKAKWEDTDRFRMSYQFWEWDQKEDKNFIGEMLQECFRVLKKGWSIICFYDLWKIESLRAMLEEAGFKQIRFWEVLKTNPVPINSKVNYLTNAREIFLSWVKWGSPTFNSSYDNGLYQYPIYQDGKRFHPTQKHPLLFEELIKKHSNEWDIVLDCFLWSGTTAIACKNTNRRFIGCEKDISFFLQAIDRMRE